jgi:acetolactate synthase I/II/III large subunit
MGSPSGDGGVVSRRSQSVRTFEAVADQLVREGVSTVFALLGDGNLRLLPHFSHDRGGRVLASRHEGGALAMADGYARVSGAVGVCSVTQGPGLTNTMTALVSARKAGTPLVLLAGDTPTSLQGHPQAYDQDGLFRAAGVPVESFSHEDPAGDIARAFARARRERTPVGLNMPTDVQEMEALSATPREVGATSEGSESRVTDPVDPEALDRAAALLLAAERPVVLAGRGARNAGAREALKELAEHAGALLATSLPNKGWFAGDPFDIGISGGFGSDLAVELLRDADVVVAFGASVNHFTSRGGLLYKSPTTLIHCDARSDALGSYTPIELGIVGDARQVAEELLTRCRAAGPRREAYRTDAVRARIAGHSRSDDFEDASDVHGIDPRTLSQELDRLVPERRLLVTDGGHFCGFPAMHMETPDPEAFVFTLDFGSVGLGLGAGIGAAVGRPDHVPVVAIGDGGLMMSLGELETAVRERIPLVVVVYDDDAYGAEMHFLRMLDLPEEESRFDNPDIAAVARSLGADAVTVTKPSELDAVSDALAHRSATTPLVVHARVAPDVRAKWLEEAFQREEHQ